jgi:hypothetical protein
LKITHPTEMEISTTFTSKIITTNGAGDVLLALDLVEQQALCVGEVFVAPSAKVVFIYLVVFQVLEIGKVMFAIGISAGDGTRHRC